MSLRFDELKATNQLPSPTGTALAVLRLADSDQTTANDIARTLQSDPALCGRLLKIANSAGVGRGRPVSSVAEAVSQLGIRMVRTISLGFSLISQNASGPCKEFNYTRFWSHSLAMGVAAQDCARHIGGIAPAEAFTFGLLAKVGQLALASIYPDIYGEILAQAVANNPADLRQLETSRLALDHSELTGAMLRDWRLPEECVLAVEKYDADLTDSKSLSERTRTLIQLLQTASLLADVCLADGDDRSDAVLKLHSETQQLCLEADELGTLTDQVIQAWHEWGAMLQIETLPVPPFTEMLEQAKNQAEASVADAMDRTLNIVLVDEDGDGHQELARQLMAAGHTVSSAATGDDGLRLVLDIAPQLVITNFQLPGMDGPSLVRALRQTKLGRELYIMMLAESSLDETQIEAFAAGADDYIVKGVSPEILAARLNAGVRVIKLQDDVRRERGELQRCMAELAIANRQLQKAACTDALTGLFNRRYAMERLARDWEDSVRAGVPIACMVLDLDHFKKVNDTHGHDIGDRVLQATAEMLRSKMRSSDAICRIGGEEFLVIGMGMDVDIALSCAERLRASIQDQTIELASSHLRVTVSVGVSVRSDSVNDAAELLKMADEAVYRAKQAGRNQVRFQPSSVPTAGDFNAAMMY